MKLKFSKLTIMSFLVLIDLLLFFSIDNLYLYIGVAMVTNFIIAAILLYKQAIRKY